MLTDKSAQVCSFEESEALEETLGEQAGQPGLPLQVPAGFVFVLRVTEDDEVEEELFAAVLGDVDEGLPFPSVFVVGEHRLVLVSRRDAPHLVLEDCRPGLRQ